MESMDQSDWTKELSGELIPPETAGAEEDVDVPAEVEEWVEGTKGVERIISVAITTTQPRTAEWIADQAVVSEQTARDHLKTFVELGVVASFTSSGVTRYHADEAFIHYREVSRYVEQYSKEELTEGVETIQARIEEIRDRFGVETPDELLALTAGEETSTAEIREMKKAASDWEMLKDQLAALEDAIRRFEKFDRVGSVKA